jgi:5-bromo-4-chloroindolyl phosphate hydrolysis protein
MWNWLSRSDDLLEIVRSTDSIGKLKSLSTFLSNSNNTQMLRDAQVHRALMEIPKRIYEIVKDDPAKALTYIIDHLL